MGLRNHTIMERTLDDVFLSGTRGGNTQQSSTGDNNNNNNRVINNTAAIDKLPLIPLMKLDAQGCLPLDRPTTNKHPYPCVHLNTLTKTPLHIFKNPGAHTLSFLIPFSHPSPPFPPFKSLPSNSSLTPLLVSLSTEGFEPQILQGASRLIKLGRIRVIKTEVAPRWLIAQGSSSREFCELLERLGYSLGKQHNHCPYPTLTLMLTQR